MAAVSKRHKFEIEILNFFDERSFKKARDALQTYGNKYNNSVVAKVLKNELKIEELYYESEETGQSFAANSSVLKNIEKELTSVSSKDDNEKESMLNAFEEAKALLLKLYFFKEDFTSCWKFFDGTGYDILSKASKYTNRPLLLAEAYTIKGICVEKKSPKNTAAAVECFEKSMVWLLKKLQSRSSINISSILIQCLNRYPTLLLKSKEEEKTEEVISFLRLLLKATSSQTGGALKVRQAVSYKLAALVSKTYCKSSYKNSNRLNKNFEPFDLKLSKGKTFSPSSIVQELVLTLQISETMLNLDPVLDMSPAFEKSRFNLLSKADCMYNLMVITFLPHGLQSLILTALNPSLKYTFDHFHLWQQFSLLMCGSKPHKEAISALSECYRINENPHVALMIAKQCYDMEIPDCDNGIEFSLLALSTMEEMEYMEIEKSRAWLSIGLGKALKARHSVVREVKKTLRQEALDSYEEAHNLDKFDSKPLLFSALELAQDRKIVRSFAKVKKALYVDPENLCALQLIALLLTSKKHYMEAKASIDNSLDMFPNDPVLLSIKCHLELVLGYKESALHICLEFFKATSASEKDAASPVFSMENMNESNYKCTLEFVKGDQMSDKQSTILGIGGKSSPHAKTLTKAWLLVAEVYITCGRYQDAENCLNEALTLYPLSPAIFVIRGKLRELEKNYEGALHLYNLALTSDPTDITAIDYLSEMLFVMGNTDLAENLLRNAATMDVTSHSVWFKLGKILENNGEEDHAMECFNYALQLEETCPVIPFTTIVPRL